MDTNFKNYSNTNNSLPIKPINTTPKIEFADKNFEKNIYIASYKNINTAKIIETILNWQNIISNLLNLKEIIENLILKTQFSQKRFEDQIYSNTFHSAITTYKYNHIFQLFIEIIEELKIFSLNLNEILSDIYHIIQNLKTASLIYENAERNNKCSIHPSIQIEYKPSLKEFINETLLQNILNMHNYLFINPFINFTLNSYKNNKEIISTISSTLKGTKNSNSQENLWLSNYINNLSTILYPTLSILNYENKNINKNKLSKTEQISLIFSHFMNKYYSDKYGYKKNILIYPVPNGHTILHPQIISTVNSKSHLEKNNNKITTFTKIYNKNYTKQSYYSKPIKILTAENMILRIKQIPSNKKVGAFEIIKHEYIKNNIRKNSWTILIRGTQRWDGASSNIQDQVTNFASIGKIHNDQYNAIKTALKMNGIKHTEPIEFVGHSQGGIIATQLASSSSLNKKYNIVSLTTFGSPTGGYKIPKNIHAMHFENLSDPVPSLDGKMNPVTRTRTTIYMDTKNMKIKNSTHDQIMYSIAAKNIEKNSDKSIQNWVKAREPFINKTTSNHNQHKSYSQLFNTIRF